MSKELGRINPENLPDTLPEMPEALPIKLFISDEEAYKQATKLKDIQLNTWGFETIASLTKDKSYNPLHLLAACMRLQEQRRKFLQMPYGNQSSEKVSDIVYPID